MLKRCFRVLLLSPEYKMQIQVCFHLHGTTYYNIYTQACIPVTLCAIHNFIRIHDGNEGSVLGQDNGEVARNGEGVGGFAGEVQEDVLADDSLQVVQEFHDHIAQHMWEDYQQIIREGNYHDNDSLSSEEDGNVGSDLD